MCHLRVGRTYIKADSYSIGLSESDHCKCGQKETISLFYSCSNYRPQQNILFGKVSEIITQFTQLSHKDKCSGLIYGYDLSADDFNCRNIPITYAVQAYTTSTKRFLQANIS